MNLWQQSHLFLGKVRFWPSTGIAAALFLAGVFGPVHATMMLWWFAFMAIPRSWRGLIPGSH